MQTKRVVDDESDEMEDDRSSGDNGELKSKKAVHDEPEEDESESGEENSSDESEEEHELESEEEELSNGVKQSAKVVPKKRIVEDESVELVGESSGEESEASKSGSGESSGEEEEEEEEQSESLQLERVEEKSSRVVVNRSVESDQDESLEIVADKSREKHGIKTGFLINFI